MSHEARAANGTVVDLNVVSFKRATTRTDEHTEQHNGWPNKLSPIHVQHTLKHVYLMSHHIRNKDRMS